jgi:hypothetical protein
MAKWKPERAENAGVAWSKLHKAMTVAQLKDFIQASDNLFKHPLDDDAVRMIYEAKTSVREDGNRVAHEADIELVRQAVVQGEPVERQVLSTIFKATYGEDADGGKNTGGRR